MADNYNIDLPGAARGAQTVMGLGPAVAQNALTTQTMEQQVQQAQERTKQAQMQTQLEQAGGLAAEKGLVPKAQALTTLRIALEQSGSSEEDTDKAVQEATDTWPDPVSSAVIDRLVWSIRPKEGKTGQPFIATEKDVNKRDENDEALIPGQSYTSYISPSGDTTYVRGGGEPLIAASMKTSTGGAGGGVSFIGNTPDGKPITMAKNGTMTVDGKPYTGPVLPKSSNISTSATRTSSEFATTLLPHIEDMRRMIQEADEKGFIGPIAGRVYGEFLAGHVGSTGNPEADRLLGTMRQTESLIRSGMLRVHFGARGGQQMYEQFARLFNSGKMSAPQLNGALDAIESFLKGYSAAGQPTGSQAPAAAPGGSLTGGNTQKSPGGFSYTIEG